MSIAKLHLAKTHPGAKGHINDRRSEFRPVFKKFYQRCFPSLHKVKEPETTVEEVSTVATTPNLETTNLQSTHSREPSFCVHCDKTLEKADGPKILPCFHLICTPCFVAKNNYFSQIPCPKCDEKFHEANIKDFKLIEGPQQPLCTGCTLLTINGETTSVYQSTHYCLVCEVNLCHNCVKIHKRTKLVQNHQLNSDKISHLQLQYDNVATKSDEMKLLKDPTKDWFEKFEKSKEKVKNDIETYYNNLHVLLENRKQEALSQIDKEFMREKRHFTDRQTVLIALKESIRLGSSNVISTTVPIS